MIHAEFWTYKYSDKRWLYGGKLYANGAKIRIEGDWLEELAECKLEDAENPEGTPYEELTWVTVADGERWARAAVVEFTERQPLAPR